MTQYRLLVRREVMQQLTALQRAADTQQPGGLRDRELRALRLGLRALANGQEESYNGKRLGYAAHDLSDCAEIKLSVIPESRGSQELGPSHRLLYREFDAEDGGPPYREVVSFEPRRDDRLFEIAAARLGRDRGRRDRILPMPTPTAAAAPPRQPLPPDLRIALAASANVAPARGAVTTSTAGTIRTTSRQGGPPEPDRQR
jgi:hypothetical protein